MESEGGQEDLVQTVGEWLAALSEGLDRGDGAAIAALFRTEGFWRDLVALRWHIATLAGRETIADRLMEAVEATGARNFRIAEARTPPRRVTRAGTDCIEALIAFETDRGRGAGVLRLVPDQENSTRMVAWILVTTLQELKGYEEKIGDNRPSGENYSRNFHGDNWLDLRRKAIAYADREPAVIVVGGGQAGLAVAARLGQLGVDTLIVDRHERIGDNWRKRYHSLTLHNEVFANHLPYMPFPTTWPTYIPKDKLANWFESYADAMELNYWTGTELVAGRYDDVAERWTVTLRKSDGSEREMRPRHLIFATGVSTTPHVPKDIPGLEDFAGTITHSEGFTSGAPWQGKHAIVLGTGTSGHDAAQDLYENGAAQVSIIQRSPSGLISLEAGGLLYALYQEGPPLDDCDLISTAIPYPVLVKSFQIMTAAMRERDKDILKGLTARGFRVDFGHDNTGIQMMYMRHGGGYYIDVGCSQLIVDEKIQLLHWENADRFVAGGLRMKDGSVVRADLLVLATGYRDLSELVGRLLGQDVAERIGPIWGFDGRGELRNMFARTPQPGLWFIGGSLAQGRIYSKYLALQIKANEEGMMPLALPADEQAGHALAAE